MPDAVVIGSGPNGLVAANLLADAGWSVAVLEAEATPGGAVRSAPLTDLDGFTHDCFSAFYPLAAASPVIPALRLEEHGLVWRHAPSVLAHPFADGRCAVLSRDIDVTVKSVESFAPGDGRAWQELYATWERHGRHVVDALFRPFPPVWPLAKLAATLCRPSSMLEFARFAVLPVRRLADEWFSGDGAKMLLAGNTLHSDLTPDSTLGGFFAWLLCMLGQDVGFPVPEGGAGALTDALVRRLGSRGGVVRCGMPVTAVVVRAGRAVAVRAADGTEVDARRAVLADVGAPALYRDLVGLDLLPDRFRRALERFEYDDATVKVDWALDGPIPWTAPEARRAGTVHVGASMAHLSEYTMQIKSGFVPARPFLLFGQMTTADPTRSPTGTETAWAYTHVPFTVRGDAAGAISGRWDEAETAAFVERMENEVEALAPGFRDRIIGRHVFTPVTLQAADANLVHGAVNGGTAALHQQLVFRPVPGWGRPETPVKALYLASASAHPGGGVHGACGANAARVALRHARLRR